MRPFQNRRWAACVNGHLRLYFVTKERRLRHRHCQQCGVVLGHGSTTRAQTLMRGGRKPRRNRSQSQPLSVEQQMQIAERAVAVAQYVLAEARQGRCGQTVDEQAELMRSLLDSLDAKRVH